MNLGCQNIILTIRNKARKIAAVTVAKIKTDLSLISRYFAHFGVYPVVQMSTGCSWFMVLCVRCHQAPGERLVTH